MSRLLASRLNPLYCGGTDLGPVATLMAKTATFAVLLYAWPKFRVPHLPFLAVFDAIHDEASFVVVLNVLLGAGLVGLAMTRFARLSSVVLGFVFLVPVLAAKEAFANHQVFYASLMLLLGLGGRVRGLVLVRWQVVLLYAGAAINKLLLADWWNGQFFFAWANQELDAPGYRMVDAWFGGARLFSVVSGWAVILGESMTAFLLAVPGLRRWGVWLALLLQIGLIVLIDGGPQFAYFTVIATVGLLAFVPWPSGIVLSVDRSRVAGRLAHAIVPWLDWDGRVRMVDGATGQGSAIAWADDSGARYTGVVALQRLALVMPLTYFTIVAIAIRTHHTTRVAALVCLFAVLSPALASVVGRRQAAAA